MSHVYDNLTHRENKRRQTDHLRPHDLDPDDVATATGPRTQVKDFDRHLDGWLDDLEGRLAPAGRQTPQRGPDDHTVPETALGGRALAEAEADAEAGQRDRARFETLVTVVREMASEMRSLRNDVEQIKATMDERRVVSDTRALVAGRPAPDDRPSE
jgi:hypothetical protein